MKKTKILAVVSTAMLVTSALLSTVALAQDTQDGSQTITGNGVQIVDVPDAVTLNGTDADGAGAGTGALVDNVDVAAAGGAVPSTTGTSTTELLTLADSVTSRLVVSDDRGAADGTFEIQVAIDNPGVGGGGTVEAEGVGGLVNSTTSSVACLDFAACDGVTTTGTVVPANLDIRSYLLFASTQAGDFGDISHSQTNANSYGVVYSDSSLNSGDGVNGDYSVVKATEETSMDYHNFLTVGDTDEDCTIINHGDFINDAQLTATAVDDLNGTRVTRTAGCNGLANTPLTKTAITIMELVDEDGADVDGDGDIEENSGFSGSVAMDTALATSLQPFLSGSYTVTLSYTVL